MRVRHVLIGICLTFVMLVSGGTSTAREVRQGDQCIIGANETIQGNLFALCRALIIDGRVEGNVMGAATKSEINGAILGDVYLISGQLDVNGLVTGDLHFAGGVLRILPTATFENEDTDLITVSLSTTLADGADIPGSVTALGYQLILDGNVGREVKFWGSGLTIDGRIGINVDADVGDPQSTGISQLQTLLIPFGWDVTLNSPGLMVTDNGVILGSLRYSAPVEGVIAGRVTGQTHFTKVITQPDLTQIIADDEGAERGLGVYLAQALREFVTLAIVGILGLFIMPRPLQLPSRNIQSRPLPSLGIGLLTFIVAFPIVFFSLLLIVLVLFIFILLQLDGLLLGLAGGSALGLLAGVALSFFFIAIFISRVIVCVWIGRVLVRAFMGDTDGNSYFIFLALLVGIALLALLSPLPVIGWVINALVLFLGLGALVISLQGQFRSYRDVPVMIPPNARKPILAQSGSVHRLPPPMLDEHPQGVGMDNLPDGFAWWDD